MTRSSSARPSKFRLPSGCRCSNPQPPDRWGRPYRRHAERRYASVHRAAQRSASRPFLVGARTGPARLRHARRPRGGRLRLGPHREARTRRRSSRNPGRYRGGSRHERRDQPAALNEPQARRPVASSAGLTLAGLACGPKPAVVPAPPSADLIVLLPDRTTGAIGRINVSNSSGAVDIGGSREGDRGPLRSGAFGAEGLRPGHHRPHLRRRSVGRASRPGHLHPLLRVRIEPADRRVRKLLPAILDLVVKARPAPEVIVIGHTDTTGSAAANLALGLKRAATVRQLLVDTGIDGSVVEINLHGEGDTSDQDARQHARARATAASRSRSEKASAMAPRLPLKHRRRIIISGLLPVFVVGALALYRPAFLTRLDSAVYDVPAARGAGQPAGRSVSSSWTSTSAAWRPSASGRGAGRPWATCWTACGSSGAATVALDIVFAEPDRFDQPAEGGAATSPSDDALAQGAERRTDRARLRDDVRSRRQRQLRDAPAQPRARRAAAGADPPFFDATGAVCSLPMLARAAGSSGFLNAAPDLDGILRRAPLLLRVQRSDLPGARARGGILAADRKASDVTLRAEHANASVLTHRRARRAARRAQQPAAPLSRREARVPLRLGRRRARRAAWRQTPSRTRSCSSARPRSAHATSCRRRSTRCSPGSEVHATVADNLSRGRLHPAAPRRATHRDRGAPGRRHRDRAAGRRAGLTWGVIGGRVALTPLWWRVSDAGRERGRSGHRCPPTIGLVRARGDDRRDASPSSADEPKRPGRSAATRAADGAGAPVAHRSRATRRPAGTRAAPSGTRACSRASCQRNPTYRTYLTPRAVDLLASLAPLHDIGKVGVPDRPAQQEGRSDAGGNGRDAPPSHLRPRRHPERRKAHRRARRRDAGAGQGDRLHAPREVGWRRLSPGPPGRAIPIAGRILAHRRRLRRGDDADALPHADVTRSRRWSSSTRDAARTSTRPSWTPSTRCSRRFKRSPRKKPEAN